MGHGDTVGVLGLPVGLLDVVAVGLTVGLYADVSVGDEQLEREVDVLGLALDGLADRALAEPWMLLEREARALHQDDGPERLLDRRAVRGVERERDALAVVVRLDVSERDDAALGVAADVAVAVLLDADLDRAGLGAAEGLDDLEAVGDGDPGELVLCADCVPSACLTRLRDVVDQRHGGAAGSDRADQCCEERGDVSVLLGVEAEQAVRLGKAVDDREDIGARDELGGRGVPTRRVGPDVGEVLEDRGGRRAESEQAADDAGRRVLKVQVQDAIASVE